MKVERLYRSNNHNWLVMGRDNNKRKEVIDTNQYLIEHSGKGLLLDPGGIENFPLVASELSKHFDLAKVEAVFASHQDPDVISSLSLWVQSNPKLIVYVPKIWISFITHFGVSVDNIRPIPDEGGIVNLNGHEFEAVPAHYLHSPGNLSLYDPQSKIFFSGDIGAALLPDGEASMFVKDFDSHVTNMTYFHQRWMCSNEAKMNWIREVRSRDVEMLCPQHGSIFKGEQVSQFLNWLENLEVGIGWKQ